MKAYCTIDQKIRGTSSNGNGRPKYDENGYITEVNNNMLELAGKCLVEGRFFIVIKCNDM